MIHSAYYEAYRGPPMTKCIVDGEEMVSKMMHAYGSLCNWQGSLWTYGELFEGVEEGTPFYCEYRDERGSFWHHGTVGKQTQTYVPPLRKPTPNL